MQLTSNINDTASTTRYETFCEMFGELLPKDTWAEFLAVWARALESYGIPLSFLDGMTFDSLDFKVGEGVYPATGIKSDGYLMRRHWMAQQQKYQPKSDPSRLSLHLDLAHCFLCENVLQGMEATPGASDSNVIFDLGTHLVLPNRYPAFPGHSLLVPKEHDPARLTRSKILSEAELETTMLMADRFKFVAGRNHVHDGMSIPSHDHFHLIPNVIPIFSFMEKIRERYGPFNWGIRAVRSPDSPFDHLILIAPSVESLAREAAPVLAAFENQGLVYSLLYSERILIVSHRFPDALIGPKLTIGGSVIGPSVFLTKESTAPSAEEFRTQVPVNGELCEALSISASQKPLVQWKPYHPLKFEMLLPFGTGGNLRDVLTEPESALWQRLLEFQDKRSDQGHAEFVTLMSNIIGQMEGLADHELIVARTAAMTHDTGWSALEDIDSVFKSIQTRLRSASETERDAAIAEECAIRIAHQEKSIEIAKKVMPDFFDALVMNEVEQIVGDHDTRFKPAVSRAGAVMWDADRIWRVSFVGFNASLQQLSQRVESAIQNRQKWSGAEHYLTRSARLVALGEVSNTPQDRNEALSSASNSANHPRHRSSIR